MSISHHSIGSDRKRPILFPNVERLVNDIHPLRKAFMSYELANGINTDNLNKDELWLLGLKAI